MKTKKRIWAAILAGIMLISMFPLFATAATPTSITLNSDSKTMVVGDTYQIDYAVFDENGVKIDDATATFASNAEGVATVNNTGEITALAGGTAKITVSSGSATPADFTVTVTADPNVIASITIDKSSGGASSSNPLLIGMGSYRSISVRVTNGSGDNISNPNVTFSYSGNDATIAQGTLNSITGLSVGTTEVTVSSTDDPSIKGSIFVEVYDTTVPTSFAIASDTTVPMVIGDTSSRIMFAVKNKGDQSISPPLTAYTFNSNNSTVADVEEVNGDMVIKAKAVGTAEITVTLGSFSDTIDVTVTDSGVRVPSEIVLTSIIPEDVYISVGNIANIGFKIKDNTGYVFTNDNYTVESLNPSIVKVEKNDVYPGFNNIKVTGVSKGTGTVRITSSNSITLDVTVKVSNPANDAESIVIDISRLEDGDKLFWGVSQTVGYQILDSQNNPILGAIAEFTSSDEKIAYFPDKNRNNFISTALGTVTITAKSADKTSVETSKTITLIPSQNQSLHVTSTNPALDINDTHQLTWEIRKNNIGLPAYGFPADNVIFAGYDTDIISVSDTGLITAKKAGTTTITMAVYDGDQPDKLSPELKTICTITVNPAPQTPAITGGDAYQPFTTDTNSPIVTFAIANATGGTWKITGDGELVGPDLYPTVDVRATGVGSFTLSYENGPTIASKTVTTFNAFSGISATDITVLPNSNTNPITATATWGGTAYTSSGYTKTAADYNISTAVKISTTGLDANLAGSANLNIIAGAVTGTYPVTLYCEAMPTVTKSINVNVSSTTPAVPASVVFTSGTPLSIPVNASRQLSWVVKDAGGQTIANAPVTFASSNTAVATVGLNTGYVTAHNTGQAIITIKTANNITATCTINVTSATTVYPTNVTFNHRYDLYIRRGDYYQLSWYFTPSNTTQTDVSFYTGDRYIATVTSYGRIYAQDYGVTTVRIRDISGHEDTVRVHVTDYYYNNDYYDDYYDDYYYWHGSSSSSSSSGSSSVSANKNTTLRASDFNTKNDSATVSAYKNSDGAYEAVLTNQMLDNLYNKNSDFELVIKGNNASVTIPADFEDIASELSSILSKNNLSASNVSFRITMEPENLSRSQQNALLNKFPNASVIGDAVDFRIEVLRTSNSRSLGTLTSFSKPIERTFKLSGNNTLPSSYGVFKINENGEIRFVPHKKTASDKLTVLSRTNSIYFVAENKVSFSDVPSGQWYTSFINNAAAKGLVAGTGGSRYEPDKTVTRAEFANMVVNALDLPYVKNSSPYRDVSSSSWYYEAVSRGNAAGLFDKLSGGDYFNGNQPITREEMASVVAQALKSQGYSQRGNTTLSMVFPNDYTYIASTYQQDVALAYESNILAGMGGGVFSPKTTTTRAQAAKVQLNLLKALKMID